MRQLQETYDEDTRIWHGMHLTWPAELPRAKLSRQLPVVERSASELLAW